MFAKFNVAYERSAAADFRDPRAVIVWATDMAMLSALEGLLYAAIKGRLPDGDDEGWAEFLAKETAFSALGTLPFIRDFSSALQGFSGGGAYGGVVDIMAKPLVQAA